MNLTLKREIIKNIFSIIGVFREQNYMGSSLLSPLNSDELLLDKKLAFETEDGNKKRGGIWAATGKIEKNEIKMMLVDISEELPEFALIVRMDNFSACALRMSADEADFGSMLFRIEEKWIDTSTSHQARILVGMENLTEIFLVLEKMNDYADMYKMMIDFLNFEESNGI
jgi:hypothetical protein